MTSGAAHLMGNLVPSEAVYSSSATQRARPKSATLTMFRRPTKQLRAAWKKQQRKQLSYRSPCSLLFAAHTPTHPNPPTPPPTPLHPTPPPHTPAPYTPTPHTCTLHPTPHTCTLHPHLTHIHPHPPPPTCTLHPAHSTHSPDPCG